QALAVGRGRAGGVAVQVDLAPVSGFRLFGRYLLLPDDLAAGAVQRQQVPPELRGVAGAVLVRAVAGVAGQEHAVAVRDRDGTARAGQFGLPDDVLGLGPAHRQAGFIADAEVLRAAEAG